MVTKREVAANLEEQKFRSDFREFIAHFDPKSFASSTIAYVQLAMADEILAGEYRRCLIEAAVRLYDDGTIVPLVPLNEAAQADLSRMRKESGVGLDRIPTPAAPPKTADQLLEEEVRHDFVTMRSDDMRRKRQGNRAYEAMYQKIADTLGAAVTSVHDLGREVGS